MRHPAAFINVIAEHRNFDEAIKHLQETWDELCEAREAIDTLRKDMPAYSEFIARQFRP